MVFPTAMRRGYSFQSINPANGEIVWTGSAANAEAVDAAVQHSRQVFQTWSRTPLDERVACIRGFTKVLASREGEIAEAISREVGKPTWEALSEVRSMISKAEFSFQSRERRCAEFSSGPAVTRFRPHGVMAVLGPFNFPGHLPNGHILPALLAGNVVVFKPSEHAPLVAELTASAWSEAGLPEGVLQVVQGGQPTGEAVARHPGIDGLFFTGGSRTGGWLSELYAHSLGKILALELGGNNPVVVWNVSDVPTAALQVAQSAFLTAGQRCTCARRLILPEGSSGDAFLKELTRIVSGIRIGAHTDRPEPFSGPVVSVSAAKRLLSTWKSLIHRGGVSLVEMKRLREGTGLVSPGLLDVSAVADREDEEIFGPLLQVIRVPTFSAAIAEANATRYGLAAALFSDEKSLYDQFWRGIRAGIINWNQPTTGAHGGAPFGGVGLSGNHRPSGFFATDYCAYPVASMETAELNPPAAFPPGLVN